MTSSTSVNLAELRHTIPDGVITSAELREAGVSNHALSARCQPSGPWQRVLPGVVLLSSAEPNRRQRLCAAVHYAKPEAVITGVDAMKAADIDVPTPDDVLLLVPTWRRLTSMAYLTVERTSRLPQPIWVDELPMAPLARATIDAARRVRDHARLKALLLAPVEAGACTIPALQKELNSGSQRGSAAVRRILADEAHQVVSMTIGIARRVVRNTGLPAPRWHFRLHDRAGNDLGVVDAWWEEVNLAWDIGGLQRIRAPSPTALAGAGMTLLQTDPNQLRNDQEAATTALLRAFTEAAANKRRNPP